VVEINIFIKTKFRILVFPKKSMRKNLLVKLGHQVLFLLKYLNYNPLLPKVIFSV